MTVRKNLQLLKPIDWLLISYSLLTGVFVLLFYNEIQSAFLHLVPRILFIAGILLLPYIDKYAHKPLVAFLRIAYPLVFISFFYSETDAFNNVFFANLDRYFARLDSILFGFQPSLMFYNKCPYAWFSEIMNFGYFSYYFLIIIFPIVVFLKERDYFEKTVFLITCSFLLYYLIFTFLPVTGPQYFFNPPHNQIADSGIFRSLVKLVEFIGERPTAAFPSSHVGIVFILLILAWPKYKGVFYTYLLIFVLLALSTVYIKAHYAVDVIGGIVSAPILLMVSGYIWKLYFNGTQKYKS